MPLNKKTRTKTNFIASSMKSYAFILRLIYHTFDIPLKKETINVDMTLKKETINVDMPLKKETINVDMPLKKKPFMLICH